MARSEISGQLLDAIYDAPFDPGLWPGVMSQIGDTLDCRGGILFGHALSLGRTYEVTFSYNGGMDDEANRIYLARHTNNDWDKSMGLRPAGRVVFSDELFPLAKLRRTPFFDEVLRPQDASHTAMIALAAKADFRIAFTVCRSERKGPFEEADRQFLTRLVPHLNRSLLLAHRLDAHRLLRISAYDALDQLRMGVVLVDRQCRVTYANLAARSHDSPEGPVRLRNGTIAANATGHNFRFQGMVMNALEGHPTGTMRLPRRDETGSVTILAASLRSRETEHFQDAGVRNAAAIIFIIDPMGNSDVPASWLIDAYGLTAAEARIATAAATRATVVDTAAKLGLSVNTVKTHLRGVFAKTGTSRLIELARLVASMALLHSGGPSRPG